jgi:TP901 family phage tail tape measure protein
MAEIGLKAVMEMTGFSAGINKYNEMMSGASSNTEKHAGIMSRALQGIGAVVQGVAVAGAAGIASLAGAMIAATGATISWAEKLDSVGDVLGTTSEESAALAVAAQHIGGNVEQLSSQMAILTRGLVDAKGEIGPTGKILKEMGISFKDANGNMLPTTDILQAVADKVGNLPDGLEKTKLMMSLFGKSGKDMSDMMGVLANGGMEAMNQKAKDLGLSMSEDAVNGAIELNRSFKDLKMMGQGLLVSFGTALLPIIKPLVAGFSDLAMKGVGFLREKIQEIMPTIQTVIGFLGGMFKDFKGGLEASGGDIGNALANMFIGLAKGDPSSIFQKIGDAIFAVEDFITTKLAPALVNAFYEFLAFYDDQIQPTLSTLVAWFSEFLPRAINVATRIFTDSLLPELEAIGNFIVTQVVPTFKAFINMIAENFVPMFMTILPKAIHASSEVFTGIIMPVLTAVFEFIRDNVIPILGQICVWLAQNIPPAIDAASKWVKETLIPALRDVWTFIKEKVIPVIQDIVIWLVEHIPPAIATAISWFKEHLLPAIKDIWAFIKDPLLPILGDIITWLIKTVTDAIATFKTIWSGLTQAFRDVSNFIYDNITGPAGIFTKVVGWLKTGFDTAVGIAEGIIGRITSAFNAVKSAIEWVITKIGEFVSAITNIKVPGWLSDILGDTGHGLREISAAFQQATIDASVFGRTIAEIGGINAGVNANYGMSSIPISSGAAAGNNYYSTTNSVNIPMNVALNNGMDTETFRVMVLDTVSGALR